ncbi:MAG: superoxide dismutase [Gammaproteobacteria bacterium]|nr:superoxide dismutase [Gammaproteobacteria bacterium]
MNIVLPVLPYPLDALEPHISRRTLAAHHGHHHADYVEKTLALVKDSPLESAPLEEVVLAAAEHGDATLFNAAAQAWNHDFYWRSLRPGGGGDAHGDVGRLIEEGFGSQKAFRRALAALAGEQFGSGWAWLVLDEGGLEILNTPNAGNLLDSAQLPLLCIDLWEHAYYLDYEHRRADYVAAVVGNLLNWDFANENLARAQADGTEAAVSWR